MPRDPVWLVFLALLSGCATGGGAPSGSLAWSPGQYYLEATVSYSGLSGPERATHSADLRIEPDGSMLLESHTGDCPDPLPAQLQRDQRRGVRTFDCGEAAFELALTSRTVSGRLLASVTEAYTVRVCRQYATTPGGRNCVRWATEDRERIARRVERLRVEAVASPQGPSDPGTLMGGART